MKKLLKNSLILSIVIMLIGLAAAGLATTDFGHVKVRNIYFSDQQGGILHGVLYQPDQATVMEPAPAVLTAHGGNTYLDQMSNLNLEFARRGYVVLSLDCNGCGLSEYTPNDEALVIGNYAGLDLDAGVSTAFEYMKSLDYVDQERMSLAGHSMGGTYITNAALSHAKDVNSILVIGSGSFLKKLPTIDPAQLIFNVGYINARYDEFVVAATQVQNTQDLLSMDFVQEGFGISENLIPGQTYGSFEDGTARVMYTPYTSHTGNLVCRESIGDMVDFFSKSMGNLTGISNTNQIWMWKEAGTLLALIGFVLFIISFACTLLKTRFFRDLIQTQSAPAVRISAWHRILCIIVCAAVPVLLLHKAGIWISGLGGSGANSLFPAVWSNVYAGWAAIGGIVILVLFLVWHFLYGRTHDGNARSYGLSTDNTKKEFRPSYILKSFLLALCIVAVSYLLVDVIYAVIPLEFRYWIFGFKSIGMSKLPYLPLYFLLFLVFAAVSTMTSTAFAYSCEGTGILSTVKQYGFALLGSIGGTGVLFLIYYFGLRITKYPPLFIGNHPNSIVLNDAMFYVVPSFAIVSIINTTLYRKTKNAYLSCFLSAFFLALLTIAGQGFTY
ncbi:alpha/beta hydrolase [Diplocloster hominis]|uniref:alpha/beta hydrolase n=1 Tax=Diplocloster hominis TaxID=3079010 RepID=UPI0031BBAF56